MGKSRKTYDSPWLGLSPFTETDAHRFFGREEERDDLFRRVTRNELTVLFAPSGVGKTSLLRAGLFPALRERRYLPIYVLFAHGDDDPPLVEQFWTQLGDSLPIPRGANRPTLWEWFHGKEIGLRSVELEGVEPVLVFDQFEELFAPGARADRDVFLEQLADLVENRVPEELEARFETGEADPGLYDTDGIGARVVFALREERLGALDRERTRMPSLMRNRRGLGPLSGENALEAARRPSPDLVPPEAAETIVRFAAETAPPDRPLAALQVDPAFLSLICEQLDLRRHRENQPTLSASLLEGSKTEILSRYYESAFADTPDPAAARKFVEDELVWEESRDNVAVERAEAAIGAGGVRGLLKARLVHTELRGGVQRLELAHDRLVPVVAAAAGERRLREAREEKARLVRGIAGLAMLSSVAVIGLVFVVVLWQRSEALRQRAEEAEGRAEYAKGTAEELINEILFDLRDQLEPLGRLRLLDDVSRSAERYFESLPESYRTDETQRNRSVMLQNRGDVLLAGGDTEHAREAYEQSLAITKRLAASDPTQESWQQDLAASWERLGSVKMEQGDTAGAREAYESGLEVAERLTASNPSNPEWQRQLSAIHSKVGKVKLTQGDAAGAREAYDAGLAVAESLVESDRSNMVWKRELSQRQLGVGDVARALGDAARARAAYAASLDANKFLTEVDKSNLDWQYDLAASYLRMGDFAMEQDDSKGAREAYDNTLEILKHLARSDPMNLVWQRDLSVGYIKIGDVSLMASDIEGARGAYSKSLEIRKRLAENDPTNKEWQHKLASAFAEMGNVALESEDIEGARANYLSALGIIKELAEFDSSNHAWQRDLSVVHTRLGDVARAQGDYGAAREAYEVSLEIRKRLVDADPINAGWQRELSMSHEKVGDLVLEEAGATEALESFETALAIKRHVVGMIPASVETRSDLAEWSSKVGGVLLDSGEAGLRARGEALLREGLAIVRELGADGPLTAAQEEWREALERKIEATLGGAAGRE